MEKDIRTRVHNISLTAEHKLSVEPYHTPDGINVRPLEINFFEFTPDTAGQYTILHEIHGITGTLVVR